MIFPANAAEDPNPSHASHSVSYEDQPQHMAERLRQRMRILDITASQLARRTQLKPSFIYDILSGKSSNPSAIKLAIIAEALGTNLHHLITSQPLPSEPASGTSIADTIVIRWLEELPQQGGATLPNNQTLPFVFNRDWVQQHIPCPVESLRLYRMRSDCLRPTLLHGDITMIDIRQQTPSPPGIFVFYDGMSMVAKRLEYTAHRDQEEIKVFSDNSLYPPYTCRLRDILIQGRMVWFSRGLY